MQSTIFLCALPAPANLWIRVFGSATTICLIVAMLFALGVGSSLAQVQPDDLITPTSADKVKDLVSPGVLQRVRNGLAMKIVATQAIEWPPPYKAATETPSRRRASEGPR